MNHIRKVSTLTDGNLIDIINTLLGVFPDANDAIALTSIVIDGNNALDEWNDGNYVDAGTTAGRGTVDAVYTVTEIVHKFIKRHA